MKRGAAANTERALTAAVVKTFSDMAFVEVVPMKPPQPQGEGFSHLLHIAFDQPDKGAIVLFLSGPCKQMIVENIYGKPWDGLQATEIDDCLLELLNVLAGNFLNERNGKHRKHRLCLPELLFDDGQIEDGADLMSMWFDAEGIPFRVCIRVDTGQ